MAAAKHSLRKWEGLLVKNLKKHGVTRNSLNQGGWVEMGTTGCALCWWAINRAEVTGWLDKCNVCPVKLMSGRTCDWAYVLYFEGAGAKPMVTLLRKTVNYLKRKKHERKHRTPRA